VSDPGPVLLTFDVFGTVLDWRRGLADAPAFRFHTEASFYTELENNYFQMMRKLIKEELGAKPLIAATSDHNHGASGYPLLMSASRLDIVDGHTYWQHPNYKDDPVTKRRIGYILNTPMVNDPLNSSVVELSRSAGCSFKGSADFGTSLSNEGTGL
jgi:hypothetical protein